MTLQELLEHAHLDALGALDEREQAAFEAAFSVAPPAVQAQVRQEQARCSNMDHLLPQVEPPAYLRERVLNAVSAAMLSESAGQDELTLRAPSRVHKTWRTATIGLLTAAVVLTVAFVNVYTTNQQIKTQFESGKLSDAFLETFGRQQLNDVLYSKNVSRVLFERSAEAPEGFRGEASIWVSSDWPKARLYADLPGTVNTTYHVVVLDSNDQVDHALERFEADGVRRVLTLASLAPKTKLALVSTTVGTALKDGTVLMTAVV